MNFEQKWKPSESDCKGTLDEESLRNGHMLTVGGTPMNRMLVDIFIRWLTRIGYLNLIK